jgi:hypothetical protein
MFKGSIFTFNMYCFEKIGKGGVNGWSTRLEPAHMVKSLDKNRW